MIEWLALPSWVLSWRLSLPVTSTQQRPYRGEEEEEPQHRNTPHRERSTHSSCPTWLKLIIYKNVSTLYPLQRNCALKAHILGRHFFFFLLRLSGHRHQRQHVFFDVYFYATELLGPPTPVPGLSAYGNAAKQAARAEESLEKFEIASTRLNQWRLWDNWENFKPDWCVCG